MRGSPLPPLPPHGPGLAREWAWTRSDLQRLRAPALVLAGPGPSHQVELGHAAPSVAAARPVQAPDVSTFTKGALK